MILTNLGNSITTHMDCDGLTSVEIGDIDAFEDGIGQALRVDFGTVSIAAVQALVRNLTYTDTFVLRSNGQRNLSLFIEDCLM